MMVYSGLIFSNHFHKTKNKQKKHQNTFTFFFSPFFLWRLQQTDFFYVESDFPALHLTEFVMRNNVKTKTAKNVEMFQYIDVNNPGGG